MDKTLIQSKHLWKKNPQVNEMKMYWQYILHNQPARHSNWFSLWNNFYVNFYVKLINSGKSPFKMSTFLHKTSYYIIWLRYYRLLHEIRRFYIYVWILNLWSVYVPKSRDCVNLYFLDRVKNIFGCVNVNSDYPLELLHINIQRIFHRVDKEKLVACSSPFWSLCPA